MKPQSQPWSFYQLHFDPTAMDEYLSDAQQDKDVAKDLKEWNSLVSSAFWEVIGYIEISIRNLLARQLNRHKSGQGFAWATQPESGLFSSDNRMVSSITEAHRRLINSNIELVPNRIIEELTFGFWCRLLTKQYLFLWPDFQRAFKGLESHNQNDVGRLMNEIRDLRNRIGRHHRIYNLDLQRKYALIMLLAEYIDPEFGTWLRSKSRVDEILALRPQSTKSQQNPQPLPPKP